MQFWWFNLIILSFGSCIIYFVGGNWEIAVFVVGPKDLRREEKISRVFVVVLINMQYIIHGGRPACVLTPYAPAWLLHHMIDRFVPKPPHMDTQSHPNLDQHRERGWASTSRSQGAHMHVYVRYDAAKQLPRSFVFLLQHIQTT